MAGIAQRTADAQTALANLRAELAVAEAAENEALAGAAGADEVFQKVSEVDRLKKAIAIEAQRLDALADKQARIEEAERKAAAEARHRELVVLAGKRLKAAQAADAAIRDAGAALRTVFDLTKQMAAIDNNNEGVIRVRYAVDNSLIRAGIEWPYPDAVHDLKNRPDDPGVTELVRRLNERALASD
jgi:hypothetical protein